MPISLDQVRQHFGEEVVILVRVVLGRQAPKDSRHIPWLAYWCNRFHKTPNLRPLVEQFNARWPMIAQWAEKAGIQELYPRTVGLAWTEARIWLMREDAGIPQRVTTRHRGEIVRWEDGWVAVRPGAERVRAWQLPWPGSDQQIMPTPFWAPKLAKRGRIWVLLDDHGRAKSMLVWHQSDVAVVDRWGRDVTEWKGEDWTELAPRWAELLGLWRGDSDGWPETARILVDPGHLVLAKITQGEFGEAEELARQLGFDTAAQNLRSLQSLLDPNSNNNDGYGLNSLDYEVVSGAVQVEWRADLSKLVDTADGIRGGYLHRRFQADFQAIPAAVMARLREGAIVLPGYEDTDPAEPEGLHELIERAVLEYMLVRDFRVAVYQVQRGQPFNIHPDLLMAPGVWLDQHTIRLSRGADEFSGNSEWALPTTLEEWEDEDLIQSMIDIKSWRYEVPSVENLAESERGVEEAVEALLQYFPQRLDTPRARYLSMEARGQLAFSFMAGRPNRRRR